MRRKKGSMSDEQAEPYESTSDSNGLALTTTIVLVTSFTPSYLLHLTCSHTRRVLLAVILAASYLLLFSPLAPSLTSYLSHCIVQLPAVCHSESCANHVTKLAIIRITSYLQSYSSCLIRHYTRHVLLALILTVSYSLSSSPLVLSLTSYSSQCIVQLPGISVTL